MAHQGNDSRIARSHIDEVAKEGRYSPFGMYPALFRFPVSEVRKRAGEPLNIGVHVGYDIQLRLVDG